MFKLRSLLQSEIAVVYTNMSLYFRNGSDLVLLIKSEILTGVVIRGGKITINK